MEGAWRKVRRALGLRLCVHAPRVGGCERRAPAGVGGCRRDVAVTVAASAAEGESGPITPADALRRSTSRGRSSSSSKGKCAICFATMRSGHGQALFTAECSHMFHFQCISSNVKHGNYVCPVCRAKWKEIPCRSLSSNSPAGRIGINQRSPQQDPLMALNRQVPNRRRDARRLRTPEPADYNDDEPLQHKEAFDNLNFGSSRTAGISSYPEFLAVPQSSSIDGFDILIHVKAPTASPDHVTVSLANESSVRSTSRAPVDLITVLDVSGSMAGTKLALLKLSMGFVVQHLGPSDRLSVIAFSSTARRLFPLRRMSHHGRQQALQKINSLGAGGGTNIADALKKAMKVIEDRSYKNSVCSIVLLSDGQDSYNISSNVQGTSADHRPLVPSSIINDERNMVPLHAFGFGADHDSDTLHSIAEASGGTFSFIEDEGVMQDAFAQCIGGLLSVAVREMRLSMECVDPGVQLCSIRCGSYPSKVARDGRNGSVDIGHLYADEERDILLAVTIPKSREQTSLLRVACAYRDPVTNETIKIQGDEVKIKRPTSIVSEPVSIEVDRERNRIQAANSIESARAAAERGTLSEAVTILEDCRRVLSESFASQSGDRLCMALDAELREMQERMANRQLYEASGRAYMLSGLSSHSWQRATARGDSTDSTTLVYSYQTPSMVHMLQDSQNHSWRSLMQGNSPLSRQ
ncbi:E3 ubiquitin-protein ligase WAV3-like isoform X2 [Phragmites australis]|uniref:E3 ubiquitin-protein ligase WAV3-like isoform X2 n=1 Tax=Phragmites australis TaxID=29695 RepID=UPI002D793751|nr:E3 ubiquitin-protein ligase WAV3-like isoform X2 [Phragmites australis]